MEALMVGQTLFFVILAVLSATLIVCLPVALFFWLVLRKRSDRSAVPDKEEDKLRKIWSGLQRMEQRIENLETILAGKRKRDPFEDAARREDVRAGRFDN